VNRARVAGSLLSLVALAWPARVSGYVDGGFDWHIVASSDLAVVATLGDVARWGKDGVFYFEGSLRVETVVFGQAAAGDTLRLFWQRQDRAAPGATYGVIVTPDDRPRHEEYAAVGDASPGVRVLWFLTREEDGSLQAASRVCLVSLSAETVIARAIRALTEQPGDPDSRSKVDATLEFLRRALADHPAVRDEGSGAQRSN
jgi:hypothetical protein